MRYILNKRGDTLIEVLICIAIVGAVITGAYALASHSLQEGLSASERTAAIKLAESQVEALKFRKKVTVSDTVWQTDFINVMVSKHTCLDTDATVTSDTNPNWTPRPNGNFPDNLTVKPSGNYADNTAHTQCVRQNNKYYIDITTPAPASPTNPTYLVTVKWAPPGSDAEGNNSLSQAQLYYRF
jgi:prepilin-type N-terminal cleavage/methylation domain-containing protein